MGAQMSDVQGTDVNAWC